ncbi:MAG: ABC transporter ATP-binding protein [Nitrososphaerota archaeon]
MSVKIEDLSKQFNGVHAVNDVNLEIEKGELFAVVGPSGSGKTTLLRLVAGLEAQDKGHIYIQGRMVDNLEPAQRNIGMVFQNYALYPNKTVLENIASPLLVRGARLQEAKKDVEELAAKLGIQDILDRLPGEISGGQQQRVALARSLIKRPLVFLLDEPLSNLDAQVRFSARKFIKQLQREFQITTLYVTHDQSEALAISDRMAVMDKGIIKQVGTPREIYNKPRDEFVAAFIGSPPLNIIDVEIKNGIAYPLDIPLQGRENSVIKIGIRPESIIIGQGYNQATVSELEFSGGYSVAYLKIADIELRAVLSSSDEVKVGDSVHFAINKKGVLFFE